MKNIRYYKLSIILLTIFMTILGSGCQHYTTESTAEEKDLENPSAKIEEKDLENEEETITIDDTQSETEPIKEIEVIQEEPAEKIKEFNITAETWKFNPNKITVKEGDTVKLHIRSIDISHGFGLSEFGVLERLEPGNIIDVEFIADKKGQFSFRCTVFCGVGHTGMEGKLIVE